MPMLECKIYETGKTYLGELRWYYQIGYTKFLLKIVDVKIKI